MSVLTAPAARPDTPASPPGPPKLSGADLRRAQAETLRTPRFRYSIPARLLFLIVDVIYGRQRTLRKFIVLEIVARVPYQAWERAAYGALTRMHPRLRLAERIFENPHLDYPASGLVLFALGAWSLLRRVAPAEDALRLLALADRFAYNRMIPTMRWERITPAAEEAAPGLLARLQAEYRDCPQPGLLTQARLAVERLPG